MKQRQPQKLSSMQPTTDQWYPNYPNDEVRVNCSLNLTTAKGKTWHRVSVWGADDCGMELDFEAGGRQAAREVYAQITSNLPITKAKLTQLGFQPA